MTKYIDAEKLKAHIQHLIKKDNYELFDVPELLSFIDSHQQEQPSLPSDLDEAANKFAVFYDQGTCDGIAQECFKAGAELIISELFEKLKITPLKVIGKDEYGYPVYDFEVGHYYRTFTLFGEKYKCDQTDSGEAGEQMMAGQGYTTEETVDRTPLNGPAGICMNLHEYDGFKLGDRVIVQIRKKE